MSMSAVSAKSGIVALDSAIRLAIVLLCARQLHGGGLALGAGNVPATDAPSDGVTEARRRRMFDRHRGRRAPGRRAAQPLALCLTIRPPGPLPGETAEIDSLSLANPPCERRCLDALACGALRWRALRLPGPMLGLGLPPAAAVLSTAASLAHWRSGEAAVILLVGRLLAAHVCRWSSRRRARSARRRPACRPRAASVCRVPLWSDS